jgi:hypothetical protein
MRFVHSKVHCPLRTAINLFTLAYASVACFPQTATSSGFGTVNGTVTSTKFGQDFTDYDWVFPLSSPNGNTVLRTNRFTVLENNLNYLSNGTWQKSDDLVEAFQDGAIARHGPNQAIRNGYCGHAITWVSIARGHTPAAPQTAPESNGSSCKSHLAD